MYDQRTLEMTGPIAIEDLVRLFRAKLQHTRNRHRNRAALRDIVDRLAVVEPDYEQGAKPRLILKDRLHEYSGCESLVWNSLESGKVYM